MTDDSLSRRRFLQATGGAATAAAVAGCQGDGGDGDGSDGGDGAADTPADTPTPTGTEAPEGTETPAGMDFDGWPYGYAEVLQEEAQRVMEEAGYGEDNRFELQWTQYTSETWQQMGQVIRDRLSAAYIDMSIEEADFSSLIQRGRNGELEAYTLGWLADYPAPDNFLQLADPPNTDYAAEGASPSGGYFFWTQETGAVRQAEEAFDVVENNPAPTGQAQQARNDAYVQLEEAIWGGLPLVPVYHQVAEPMWYDRVDYSPHGSMGGSRQKNNNISVEGKDRLDLINATIRTLDPIESTDTAGGTIIQNVFDTLTNYPDGEAAVENLLVEGFETSADFTTYTFELKQGVTFHDGTELTAEDVVYSWRRLAESGNSNRVGFITGFLGVTHETDGDDNVVPDTLGVEAVDDYTFRVELEEPFASALSMMAYTSFAPVPEGLVGDIEGHDGTVSQSDFATGQSYVGTGPFEFEEWSQGESASITRYDDYHGDVADVEGVNWAIIEDSTAQYNYFMNENADIAGIPTAQYDPGLVSVDSTDDLGRDLGTYGPVRNGETLNYASVPSVSTFYVGFNTEAVPLPVRRAMAYVVDQHQFTREVFKSRGEPGYHLTPPLIFPGGGNTYTRHADPEQEM